LLYSAMEDRFLDLVIGKGGGARSIRVDLPQFTLVGATTKPAMLSAPLRSRFGAEFRLNFYTPDELSGMIMSKSSALELRFGQEVSDALASRSRMTARIAVRMLKRLRDWVTVHQIAEVQIRDIEQMLETLGVDLLGLDDLDRRILATMYYKFNNKAIGLTTIAASLSEDSETIETVCEPFLLQLGLIERTPRGRVLTAKAVQYIEQNQNQFINLI
jgi:Holliday junction DNA helicase RuvB